MGSNNIIDYCLSFAANISFSQGFLLYVLIMLPIVPKFLITLVWDLFGCADFGTISAVF
jgi:hypothetical protein